MPITIKQAKERAAQIFEEERRYPTVKYTFVTADPRERVGPADHLLSTMEKFTAVQSLQDNREHKPRNILVLDNGRFQFTSENYELLVILLTQVSEADRQLLLEAMALAMRFFPGAIGSPRAVIPLHKSHTSELRLIAEFLIRNGGREVFFAELQSAKASPGIAVMLNQLEDVVALNYQIFSESEYAELSNAVKGLRKNAAQLASPRTRPQGSPWENSYYSPSAVGLQVVESCNTTLELCRKASFLYLRSSLKQEINLEINQDKYVVQEYLSRLGFSEPLISSLNEAERLSHATASPFELKSSMGHLRSFLEHLHAESIPSICSAKNALPPEEKWGAQLAFLKSQGIISKQEEQFVAGLFVLISDEAVHSIIAEREYARLARNMVIEYAVLFLKKLSKFGFSGIDAQP